MQENLEKWKFSKLGMHTLTKCMNCQTSALSPRTLEKKYLSSNSIFRFFFCPSKFFDDEMVFDGKLLLSRSKAGSYIIYLLLKVSKSRKQFMVSSILPKNERKNSTLLLWYLRSNCFLLVFGRMGETINCFQDLLSFIYVIHIGLTTYKDPLLQGKPDQSL